MSSGDAEKTAGNGPSASQCAGSNARSEDLEWVRRAADGDAAAFRSLVDRHSEGLFRLAYSLSATRTDAEDLLQETFVGALGGLSRFNGASSVKTWLTSILMRQAAKAWHRNRHHRRTRSIETALSGEPDRQTPTAGSTGVSDSTGSGQAEAEAILLAKSAGAKSAGAKSTINRSVTPSGSVLAAGGPMVQSQIDLRADLEAALARMEPAYRQVLILRELQQLSYEEIARSLGVPKGTVESRLFRARADLRRRLKGYH